MSNRYDNSLDKLVADVIEQIDWELWKEIHLLQEKGDEFRADNQIKDLIKNWFYTVTGKDYND